MVLGVGAFDPIGEPVQADSLVGPTGRKFVSRTSDAVNLGENVATAAGGALVATLGTGAIGIYYGTGLPTVSAVKGSLYIRSDGSSSSTRLYVNTDGATTWTNVTTAA